VTGDCHARICGSRGARFPPATRPPAVTSLIGAGSRRTVQVSCCAQPGRRGDARNRRRATPRAHNPAARAASSRNCPLIAICGSTRYCVESVSASGVDQAPQVKRRSIDHLSVAAPAIPDHHGPPVRVDRDRRGRRKGIRRREPLRLSRGNDASGQTLASHRRTITVASATGARHDKHAGRTSQRKPIGGLGHEGFNCVEQLPARRRAGHSLIADSMVSLPVCRMVKGIAGGLPAGPARARPSTAGTGDRIQGDSDSRAGSRRPVVQRDPGRALRPGLLSALTREVVGAIQMPAWSTKRGCLQTKGPDLMTPGFIQRGRPSARWSRDRK
jgi:hypothetical protein